MKTSPKRKHIASLCLTAVPVGTHTVKTNYSIHEDTLKKALSRINPLASLFICKNGSAQ